MTLYFAYGSNMDCAAMKRRCPAARPVGAAVLDGYRFYVGIEGWGSVRRVPGSRVHGVVWRLTPRDIAALHVYELFHTGLYDMRILAVRHKGRSMLAMVYVLRRRAPGRAKPGYIEVCASAARDWRLPESYVRSLERCKASRWIGGRPIVADGGAA